MNPGQPLTSCVTVGKSLPLSGLSFLICKMGTATPARSPHSVTVGRDVFQHLTHPGQWLASLWRDQWPKLPRLSLVQFPWVTGHLYTSPVF